ncbi:uncharacterized protein LOC128261384 [Drosophila gunungcola]|uniref:Uncharacterized protein n=1 Tax=Drosophila gunungcola TaxID=103775 RepID=A0A9P9YSY4_9MUSC|nr:uncharacterized protein LOC128261384 [Drosophila gunungcola]KAI8042528.1 hypothetical protein M5D96_003841 [Drosophila gunungcola]
MDNDSVATDENPAQQSIALRRELRRKKILEASKSRLDKLNGRATTLHNENLDEGPANPQYSDPEVEPDVPINRPFLPEHPVSQKTSAPNAFVKSRVHIVLAACVGFLLALYTNSSVFLPVLLFVILELAFLQYHKRDNLPASVGPMLLMFINPSITNKIKQFSSIFLILQSLLGDLAITVCVVCSGSMLLLNLNTDIVTVVK